jgi:hypothetical protein
VNHESCAICSVDYKHAPKKAVRDAHMTTAKESTMRRVNDVTYDVRSGEPITIQVTPTNFGGSGSKVQASLDDQLFPPPFQFTAVNPVGQSHRVMMEFSFFDDNPNNAVYVVAISGQNDVGCPCGFQIAKTDNVHAAGIRFRVRADV